MPALLARRRARKKKPKKRRVVRRPAAKQAAKRPAKAAAKPAVKPAPKPAPAPAPAPARPSATPSSAPTTQPVQTVPRPAPPAQVPAGERVGWLPAPVMAATSTATDTERLFLNRFGTGFSQSSLQQLRRLGSPQQWLQAQLAPARFEEHPKVATVDGWFSSLRTDSPALRWRNQSQQVKGGWIYGHELGNWSILRRIYSERTTLETMVDFWSANLHIPIHHDRAWIWRADYDATIRDFALGRFEDLLAACTLHPSMLLYLDNYRSVRGNPNENHGRELLELHTVGRAAGYTEAMVVASAKILSGWSVEFSPGTNSFDPVYDTKKHTTGPVDVLGFARANAADDGRQLTRDYLSFLARHPATARNLARKLTTWFVADDASDALVGHLAQVYLDADTAIAPVLTALAAHPEFLASGGKKVRTPIQDLVATARVLEVDANQAHTNGEGDDTYAQHANWNHQSLQAFAWPRPDGAPARNAAWSTPSRMFGSYQMHWGHTFGWWPKGAAYKPGTYWVKANGMTFDAHVDHVCQRLFGRSADARLLRAARQAVAGATWFRPDRLITADSEVHRWIGLRVIATLLDSPDHMLT